MANRGRFIAESALGRCDRQSRCIDTIRHRTILRAHSDRRPVTFQRDDPLLRQLEGENVKIRSFSTALFRCLGIPCLGFCLGIASAGAQSISIDFGSAQNVPPPSFGGAGPAGVWNGIPGTEFTQYSNLVDIEGASTSITFTNVGGAYLAQSPTSLPAFVDSLLEDYLVTENPALETCLFFHGLENGTYLVTVYGWFPDDPTVESYVTVDQSSDGGQAVGGAWSGALEFGMQYSQHLAIVTQGDLYPHSGIPAGSSSPLAVLNAIQLERLPDPEVNFLRGDANQDGAVDVGDVTASLSVLFAGTFNTCADSLDANEDESHDIGDPIHVISYLFVGGPPPSAPFDNCGTDRASDLGCEAFSGCP